MNSSISTYLLVAIFGALSSYFGNRLVKDKKIEKDATVLATVLTKLDNIIKAVEEIRFEVKLQEKTNRDLESRLAKVEVSAKEAHRRINELRAS